MGGMFSSLFDSFFGPYRYKITMVGLDNSGKTTILFKLALGEVVSTQPTVGCNVENVRYKNVEFQVWDLGGQTSLRSIWSSYYAETNALILTIDSSDRDRLDIVKSELNQILATESLSNALLLIYANKQDTPQCMTPVEIANALDLTELKRPFHIQGTCALNGDGLYQGIEWITSQLPH